MLDKILICILVTTQPKLTNISSSESPFKIEKIESVYTENINLKKKSYQLICTDGKKKRNDNHKNIPVSTRIASKR